ncbi:MAG: RluA family pseudouridine synthase [Anaerolineales bacterium]
MHIPILYADEALLVVNKPTGLLTIPDAGGAPCLHALLEHAWGRLWVVHRLDRETSGVLLLARTAKAHRALNAQFQTRRTRKVYHALAWGNPPWETVRLDAPLRVNVGSRHRTVVDARRGKPALTVVSVLHRLETCTLLEAQPHTGRRHQIRAHLYAAGFPLVGDSLYGHGDPPQSAAPLSRLGLHAHTLEVQHPLSGQSVTFTAPWPEDFIHLPGVPSPKSL